MKKSLSIIATIIFCLYLSGCTRNNADDDLTSRRRNAKEITRVNFNNRNQVGPAISSTDTSDPELDRSNVRNDINAGSNNPKTRVADKAADRVTDLSEVDDATVIVNDNNAYVAAKLHHSSRNQLTSDIKDKITRTVKSADKHVDNVYVSTNPDFYDRMKRYSGDIRNGRPISGFRNEFSDTIRRVFPNAK
jgi:spore cortex protein